MPDCPHYKSLNQPVQSQSVGQINQGPLQPATIHYCDHENSEHQADRGNLDMGRIPCGGDIDKCPIGFTGK